MGFWLVVNSKWRERLRARVGQVIALPFTKLFLSFIPVAFAHTHGRTDGGKEEEDAVASIVINKRAAALFSLGCAHRFLRRLPFLFCHFAGCVCNLRHVVGVKSHYHQNHDVTACPFPESEFVVVVVFSFLFFSAILATLFQLDSTGPSIIGLFSR